METFVHNKIPGGCFSEQIDSIVEMCDNEYYLSALGPPLGDLNRAKRGVSRILGAITSLEEIDDNITCVACQHEIAAQIIRQKIAVSEISIAWGVNFV